MSFQPLLPYPKVWLTKADCLYDLDRLPEATVLYQEVVEVMPYDGRGWFGLGRALYALKRYDEALNCFDKALEVDTEKSNADRIWAKKSLCNWEMKRYQETVHCCQHAVEYDPESSDAWSLMGDGFGRMGQHAEAVRCYRKCLEFDHAGNTDLFYNYGTALANVKQFEEAEAYFDRCLTLNAADTQALYAKAVCLDNQGQRDEAEKHFERLNQIEPRHAGAWFMRGMYLNQRGRLTEADSCLAEATRLAPDDGPWWIARGVNMLEMKQFAAARASFDRAVTLEPENWQGWYHKALAEDGIGNREAINSYARFLRLAPDGEGQYIEYARRRIEALQVQ